MLSLAGRFCPTWQPAGTSVCSGGGIVVDTVNAVSVAVGAACNVAVVSVVAAAVVLSCR